MSPIIKATFLDGVLKPEEALSLPSGTKVRLNMELWPEPTHSSETLVQLDRMCDESPIDSRGGHLTREQLHECR